MTMTLEQKLRAVMSIDDTGRGPLGRAGEKVGECGSDRDLDLMTWGAYYGIAFGIARHEDPFEPHEAVAARALHTAWPIYLEHSGSIARPGSGD